MLPVMGMILAPQILTAPVAGGFRYSYFCEVAQVRAFFIIAIFGVTDGLGSECLVGPSVNCFSSPFPDAWPVTDESRLGRTGGSFLSAASFATGWRFLPGSFATGRLPGIAWCTTGRPGSTASTTTGGVAKTGFCSCSSDCGSG